jgi:heme-degrading monooxygenase HmoA
MPVLEITQLHLKGMSANDPQLLHVLSDVRARLKTKSQFYTCIEDPTKVYILGMWRDLEQHLDFLASPLRDEVLGIQANLLDFQWTIHMELESMSSLPLDAPILAIERLSVEEDYVVAVHQATTKYMQHLEGSRPFRVAYGSRCDTMPGIQEVIIFSGWENSQAHVRFSVEQHNYSDTDGATISGHYKELVVHHAKNLERREA